MIRYLPPECLQSNGPGTKTYIQSSVDVYSCGVILYQMLYGLKPFGQNMNPDDLARMMMSRDHSRFKVPFPDSPTVSPVTKRFIERCLAFNPQDRPKIHEVHNDEYFKPKAIPGAKV
jgi:tousled-like kinase